jgi:hypothetical protein
MDFHVLNKSTGGTALLATRSRLQLSQAAAIQGEKLQVPVMEILQGMRDMLHEKKIKRKSKKAVIHFQ